MALEPQNYSPQGMPSTQSNKENQKPVPRPYSWQTDELNARSEDMTTRMTMPIDSHRSIRPANHATSPIIESPNASNLDVQKYRGFYHCPRCGTQLPPIHKQKISTTGWIVFAILLLFFFPLFWIGLLIKEDVRECPVCHVTFH